MATKRRRSHRYSRRTKNNQARLVLVAGRDVEDLRRYSQSTSGRISSTGTLPPLSRSRAMANDSPISGRTDSAFRRYPIEVPHRLAKSACPAGSRLLRYSRSTSMPSALPAGNFKSIPRGHLPAGTDHYAASMGDSDFLSVVYANRRKRLAELLREFGNGKQSALADAIEERLDKRPELKDRIKAFGNATYISRALKGPAEMTGGKNISEEAAEALEQLFGKADGWMSRSDHDVAQLPWPFPFSRAKWDALDPEQRREASRHFEIHIDIISASTPATRRKPQR